MAKEASEAGTEIEQAVSSFQSYAAEGDILAKQGNYQKAIDAYSKALLLRPLEKNVLVARSKCYLQLGDTLNALKDADASLTEETDFFKGVFQKAEALYSQGDFEMALVYYHRGNKFRPELDEFRLGIQKAREAIDNSIGNPKDYKFQPPPGARLVVNVPSGQSSNTKQTQFLSGVWVSPKVPTNNNNNNTVVAKDKWSVSKGEKSAKQLLGELYSDKEYLEQFVNDRDFSTNPNAKVKDLVDDALKYLDTRTEFWRQQKPIYARKKDHSKDLAKTISIRNRQAIITKGMDHKKREALEREVSENPKTAGGYKPRIIGEAANLRKTLAPKKPIIVKSQTQIIIDTGLGLINNNLMKGDFQAALKKAKGLLAKLTSSDTVAIQIELNDIIAGIYQKLGNAKEALSAYQRELSLSRTQKFQTIVNRALGEIGRIHIQLENYPLAIESFQECLQDMSEVNAEKACFLHDIGRCFLHLKKYEEAAEYGERCIHVCELLNNLKWTLNAHLLVAKSQAHLKVHDRALHCYTVAFNCAKQLNDKQLGRTILKSLNDTKRLQSQEHANTPDHEPYISFQSVSVA
ncbi:hypothetical protein BC833DRAFT_593549 [Globomyces pollinis-pini]|nr:hypothetical protein BC833DRAFT_593549 [Globomyces pollinis-pini]